MNLRRLAKDTLIYGAGTMLSPLVGFLLLPVYTRFLSPSDYGVLAVISVTTAILTVLLSLGLPSGMVRIFFDYETETEKNQVIYSSLGLLFGITGATGLLIFLGAGPLSRLLLPGNHGVYLVKLLGVAFATGAWTGGLRNLLRAQQKSTLYTAASLGGFTLRLFLNILFVVFLVRGVRGIMEAGIIANLASAAFMGTVGLWGRSPSFSGQKLRQVLRFGVPLVPGNLASWALTMADRYFLQHMTTMAELGLYSVGYKIGQVAEIGMVKPFRLAWPPLIYSEAQDPSRAKKTIARVATAYAFFGLWVFTGLYFLAPGILKIIAPPRYWGASAVVGLVSLSYVILGSIWITGAGLHLIKKPAPISWAFILGAGLNLALNALMVPLWGMMGAAWATLASYAALSGAVLVVSQRNYPVAYQKKRLLALIAWAGALVVLSLVSKRVWWRAALVAGFPLPGLYFYRKRLFGIKRAYLVRRDLSQAHPDSRPSDLRVVLSREPEDLAGFREGMEETYRKRLQGGIRAYLGLWKGSPAHLTWVATEGEREKHTGYRSKKGVAYIFDSLTLPRFRGRGIYRAVLEEVCQRAKDDGLILAEAVVFQDNEASLRAFSNAGFVPVARLTGLKLFGITITLRRKL